MVKVPSDPVPNAGPPVNCTSASGTRVLAVGAVSNTVPLTEKVGPAGDGLGVVTGVGDDASFLSPHPASARTQARPAAVELIRRTNIIGLLLHLEWAIA